MRSFWSDPYLWVHLAGVAAVPIFLDFCLLGLAVGEPILPSGVEIGLVAVAGILPVLWMQWRSPFYIFSLLAIALRPTRLTDDQRRILRQFKTPLVKILTTLTAIVLGVLLWQLYQLAPIAAVNSPWNAESRWLGLTVAASAFLGANLFGQVPASVVAVLMTSKRAFASVKPYPPEEVFKDFTVLGLPVRQVLPPAERVVPVAASASQTTAESTLSEAARQPSAEPKPSAPAAADVVIIPSTDVVELTVETPSGVVELAVETVEGPVSEADEFDEAIPGLEGLSETLVDAFSSGEDSLDSEGRMAASPREAADGGSGPPLRQPPSYEDPESNS